MLYYGSFLRCFPSLEPEGMRERIRKVILHEFRHHLESLAGERDLEIEDEIEISRYKYRKEGRKYLTNKRTGDRIDEVDFLGRTNVREEKTLRRT